MVALLAWGLIVLAFSAGGLADVTNLWWLVLLIGAAAPVALVAARGWSLRASAISDARSAERDLLGALREHGDLTPTAAAILTRLTAAEASKTLERLAREGHLETRTSEGAISYALREGDRNAITSARTKTTSEPAGAAPENPAPPAHRAGPIADPLSDRELAVLRLLAAGRTNKAAAGELFVAQGTVKAHTASIYRKLGVHSRAEAIARAADLGLL